MTEGEREVCEFCRDWGMGDCEKCELKKKRENQNKEKPKEGYSEELERNDTGVVPYGGE